MLALGFGLLLFSGQRVDKKLTLDIPAMSMDRALQVISLASGELILTTPQMKDEVLIATFKDAPFSEVREKTAKALHCFWEKRGDTWYVGKSLQQRKEEEDQYRKLRYEKILTTLEQGRKRAAALGEFDSAQAKALYRDLDRLSKSNPNDSDGSFWKRVNQSESKGPSGRMVSRLMSLVTPEMFVDIAAGQNAVFSNKPTSMQYRIPFAVDSILAKFSQEQNQWASATGGNRIEGPKSPGGGTYWLGQLSQQVQPLSSTPTQLMIKCSTSVDGSISMSVMLADSRGKLVGEAEQNRWSVSEDDAADAEKPPTKPEPAPEKIAFELSPISKQFQAFSQPWRKAKDDKTPAADAATLNQFYFPEKRDPLSYGCSESIFAYAEAKGKNIAAAGIDALISLDSPDSLASMRKFGRRFSEVDMTDEGNWIVLRSNNPRYHQIQKFNRNDLGMVMRTYRDNKKLSIENEALLALMLPDDQQEYRPISSLIEATKGDARLIYNEQKILRLFATMSQQERRACVSTDPSGGGMPLSRLNQNALRQIFEMVYFGEQWMMQYNPQEAPGFDPAHQDENMYDAYYNGILKEPTISMPNGIPNNATIKLSESSAEVLRTGRMQHKNYEDEGRFVDIEELAWMQFSATRPDLYPWAQQEYNQVNTSDMRLFQQRTIMVEIKFGNGMSINRSLQEAEAKPGGKFSLDNLPEALKVKYKKRYKELVDQAKGQVGSGGGDGDGEPTFIPPALRQPPTK